MNSKILSIDFTDTPSEFAIMKLVVSYIEYE